MNPDRREFLKGAAITAATIAGSTRAAHAAASGTADERRSGATDESHAAAQPSVRTLSPALLSALGEAVLPEALGADGRTKAVRAFSTWLDGYVPVSEEMHGYGNQEITWTPSDPAPGWSAQLGGMDLLARRRHGLSFPALSVEQRREIVRGVLARQRGTTLPSNPLTAPHVAIGLLAHWAGSSEATDLAYGARISRENCRVLAYAPNKPQPIAGGRS